MNANHFHPVIAQWFSQRFGQPTDPQRLGWPPIARGENTLIAAPTGSGKTLAGFLVCLDRLFRRFVQGQWEESIQTVYVSPLKALSNDIQRNLQTPLEEIRQLAESLGLEPAPIRVALRTGDTPASQRQAMLRRPPHLLVTTPESLYLLLTAEKSRALLRSVETVIVDEIHALARDKRGSHLALSLERLEALCDRPPVRIGLSATQRPIDRIAKFLVGVGGAGEPERRCQVVDVGHVRELDLAVETPPSELAAVCSHEQWDEVYQRLTALIRAHRSTLIFVNTRRLAERVSHHLTEVLGEDAVASHHGSLARPIRLSAEQRLKSGELKAIVATASLEMGIDIGYIDLVCQIGSPRSIATCLQRVGRAGHSLAALPKGRLFPLTRDELLECMALVRAVGRRMLDSIEIPRAPLDILAQQLIAEVAAEPSTEQEMLRMVRRAWPYRDLAEADFQEVLKLVSEGAAPGVKGGRYLHWDQIGRKLRARRGARLAAITSGGAIPETAEYRVVTEQERTFVGSVDEDFAIESLAGDVFLLGNTSWRVRRVLSGEVVVQDAEGAPPNIPFWFGEGPGRTFELSGELSSLRRDIAEGVEAEGPDKTLAWLQSECGASEHASQQAYQYVATQLAAIGCVPTGDQIVFERFFDESGGMQLVIHAPLGARINRAWGLALRKRFCRSFDFELQAAADDNGVVLSLSPQHSFPIDNLFRMLGPHNGQYLLEQAVLAAPMFQVRWRWNATRALAILRREGGRKTPPFLQRFRADDLLAATFPETVGCLENHEGDVKIPDHPLVKQTMHDCFHEAMDLRRWLALLDDIQQQRVQLIPRDTREPSPFAHELLNANPYAFLDGAPLEERRTRAVSARRTLDPDDYRDLARLDDSVVAQISQQAWPTVRDEEELHDALMSLVVAFPDETTEWRAWLERLAEQGRATCVQRNPQADDSSGSFWIAAERWPLIAAVYDQATPDPPVHLPDHLAQPASRSQGWVELTRGRITHGGPTTAAELAQQLCLPAEHVWSALEALEGEGVVMRGQFSSKPNAESMPGESAVAEHYSTQWCERRLLARMHRQTLEGLRQRIKPVAPEVYVAFLARRHFLTAPDHWAGPVGLREVIGMLQGLELPAGAWEDRLFAHRMKGYEPEWLDHLFLTGEVSWGRINPPLRDRPSRAVPSRVAPSRAAPSLTRAALVSIMLRSDLGWLLAEAGERERATVKGYAAQIQELLLQHGALFYQDLQSLSQLLPGHLDEGLAELAAMGLATSDAYGAVRSIVHRRPSRRRRPGSVAPAVSTPVGRWSSFPPALPSLPPEQRIAKWCRQLLRRYGVVFRDLLTRESAAPAWGQLVPVYRRMELRGEIRGGRFVEGVAGEQFAEERAVEQLRAERERTEDEPWVVIGAADPLNLAGIVTGEAKIPASSKNALVLRQGRCVASKQSGQIEFHEPCDQQTRAELRLALQTGSRRPPHDWAAVFQRRLATREQP